MILTYLIVDENIDLQFKCDIKLLIHTLLAAYDEILFDLNEKSKRLCEMVFKLYDSMDVVIDESRSDPEQYRVNVIFHRIYHLVDYLGQSSNKSVLNLANAFAYLSACKILDTFDREATEEEEDEPMQNDCKRIKRSSSILIDNKENFTNYLEVSMLHILKFTFF